MWYKLKRIMMRPNGVEKQVRPTGWTPWANTIAYYPLTSTTQWTDKSWNWFNLTNWWWVSFGTYQWVDCWYFSGKNCLKRSSWNIINNWQTTFTWLAWIYFNGSFVDAPRFFSNYNQANWYFILYNWSSKIVVYSWSTSNWVSVSTGWWHLYWISWNYGSGTFTWYKDTTSNSWSWSWRNYWSWLVVWGTNSATDSFGWYMSEVIYENKTRTAQEVQAYYNLTKSKYWL